MYAPLSLSLCMFVVVFMAARRVCSVVEWGRRAAMGWDQSEVALPKDENRQDREGFFCGCRSGCLEFGVGVVAGFL